MDFTVYNNNHGSAMMVVLALLVILTIVVSSIMRMTVYGADIVSCRGRTIAHDYAVDGLIIFGYRWYKQQDDKSLIKDVYSIYDGPWFEDNHTDWRGIVRM